MVELQRYRAPCERQITRIQSVNLDYTLELGLNEFKFKPINLTVDFVTLTLGKRFRAASAELLRKARGQRSSLVPDIGDDDFRSMLCTNIFRHMSFVLSRSVWQCLPSSS